MLLTDTPIRQLKPIDKPRKLLKQARERRDAARKRIADGVDPSSDLQAGRAQLVRDELGTLEAMARERFAEFGGNWVALHAETRIHRVEDHVP
jgi:hypothetical protein